MALELQLEALRRGGFDVTVVSLATDDLLHTNRYSLNAAARVATGLGKSPKRALEEIKPDVVHVHNLFPNWGTRWLKEMKIPTVASIHNYRPVCASGTLYRDGKKCVLCPTEGSLNSLKYGCYRGSRLSTLPLTVATAKPFSQQDLGGNVDQIVFLSQNQKETYESFEGPIKNSTVLPNFVPDIRQSFPKSGDPEGWCYIGRISEEKGILDLVNVWPTGQILDIYGDGPEVSTIESLTGTNVRFHGSLRNEQVPEVLEAHQGLVFPSKVLEISPLVYIEALRSSRPVVAFSGNAAGKDIEANGGRGGKSYVDLNELESCLRELENSETARQGARERYLSTFSEPVWIEGIRSIYNSVL